VINADLGPTTRWGLNALLFLSTVVILYFGRTVILPTIFSLLLAAMLWPATSWLNLTGVPLLTLARCPNFPWCILQVVHWRLSWGFACMTMVTGLVALNILITVVFSLSITRMIQDMPTTEARQATLYKNVRDKLEALSPVPLDQEYFPEEAKKSKVFQVIANLFDPNQPYIIQFLREVGSAVGYWVWEWILIMFILLFLMVEGRMLSRRVTEIFGPGADIRSKTTEALTDMAAQVRTYLVWRTLINFTIAGFLGVIYYFIGLKQPWTWALLTAILWYVPYLGPIAAGAPPIIDAFVTCDTALPAIGILVCYTFVVTLEGYVIVPLVMGHSMELNATTVMLACLFWELVWGLPGLFLAMPLMAAIKAICSHVPDLVPWANLMSTREGIEREEVARKMSESILGGDGAFTEKPQKTWPPQAYLDE
jgi:predicted PurR-regulated permease PerM